MTGLDTAERDAAIGAMLAHVPVLGWSKAALHAALPADPGAAMLFAGPGDMVEAYVDLADRRMAAAADVTIARLSGRVRSLIALRLLQARDEREAVRRAMAVLALPANLGIAARTLARTVDAIWHAAGDRPVDWNWYTKRASLAAVYGATLLFWLRQDPVADPHDAHSLAFLDRRLAGLARAGRWSGRASAAAAGVLPARLRAHPPTRATVSTPG